MDSTKCFRIEKDAQIPFNNKVDYCIGTGRMGPVSYTHLTLPTT